MGSRRNPRRAGAVTVLSTFMIGVVFGLTACSAGDGDPSTLPSARASERSIDRPASDEPDAAPTPTARPSRTEGAQPTRSRQPEPTTAPAEPTVTRPSSSTAVAEPEPTQTTTTGTAAPAPTTTRPPTSAAVVAPAPTQTTRTTAPAQTTPAPAASATAAAAAESAGVGPLGWFVVLALVAAMIVGGLLVYRSQRKSAWDAEARAVEVETRTVTGTRLPPVLTATTAAQRDLAWLPVRASLTDLASRWNALAERAVGEPRRNWSLQLSGLLQDLIAAVDAENEALALGRDWMLLRPRINRVEEALAGVLASQPQPEPPAAGEPEPPAVQI